MRIARSLTGASVLAAGMMTAITAKFGNGTVAAVKAFQKKSLLQGP